MVYKRYINHSFIVKNGDVSYCFTNSRTLETTIVIAYSDSSIVLSRVFWDLRLKNGSTIKVMVSIIIHGSVGHFFRVEIHGLGLS